jgi:2-haloacid dehalogenase
MSGQRTGVPHRIADEVSVLAFDIFGTTVDWRTGVADQVAAIAMQQGVSLDGYSFADDWRGRYLPAVSQVQHGHRDWCYLDVLHREALDDLLDKRGLSGTFGEDARAAMVRAWHRLPAWGDVLDGLARLRTRYILAALSNGGFALLTRLVKHAGLPLDCVLSAELARTYKPDPRVYLTAAGLLDVRPSEVMLVAAHDWDIDGARAAGLRTAFVERPTEKGPSFPPTLAGDVVSDLSATSFGELATLLGC